MKPDLDDPAARYAYRSELRAIAVLPRRIGLMLLVAGVIIFLLPMWDVHAVGDYSTDVVALCLIATAWLLLGFAMWVRSRYHNHRMRGGAPR